MAGYWREQLKLLNRSSGWRPLRNRFIAEHPSCAACGTFKGSLQIHHIEPFHVKPELELEWTNLITLCGKCHFTLGHANNWQHWNVNIKILCTLFEDGVRK